MNKEAVLRVASELEFIATVVHTRWSSDIGAKLNQRAVELRSAVAAAPEPVACLCVHCVSRMERQATVKNWCANAFGHGQASSIPQRGVRLAEEAIEAAQASGVKSEMLHRLIDHIYAKPIGTLSQELGGVGVTVLALAAAAGLSADVCEEAEVRRVLSKPLEHFKARNDAKNAAGFDTSPLPLRP